MVTPAARREAVIWIRDGRGVSERRACGLASCTRSVARYRLDRDPQEELRARLRELAARKPRYGYRRLTALLRRAGERVNPKRVHRLYRLEGLSVRRKKRKKLARAPKPVLPRAEQINQRWCMDFVEDSLATGRKLRTFNVLDEHPRECLVIEADTSLPAVRVTRVLERLVGERGAPVEITVDNGPEYTSTELEGWAEKHGVTLHFNRPGKPTDNPFIESFNGKFRDECLNENWFLGVRDARRILEAWRREYNEERPHSSLGYLTPAEFAALRSPSAPCAPQTPKETNPPGELS
jgi:putative transposase